MQKLIRIPISVVIVCAAALASLTGLSTATLSDESYPNRPITLIVHSAAGGSIDLVNRLFAEKVSAALGQPIILEFRPGGGATIGATAVARAQPDGYTIGFLGSSIPAAQGLGKPLLFDVRDFVPLAQIINLRLGLQVNPSLPVRSLSELVALAKARPGKLNYASTGYGSAPHIATEFFMRATGTRLTHVPYPSGAVAMQDLIAGRVDFYIDGTSIGIPLHKTGQIRILAVTGNARTSAAPDIPTMREAGFGPAEYYAWGSWVMPPKAPPEIAKRVSDAVLEAATDDGIRKRLDDVGVEVVSSGPAELETFINLELAKYLDLAKSANIKFE
jgi:tripartite-type tricarboxylate transporter receptor subunit TctC